MHHPVKRPLPSTKREGIHIWHSVLESCRPPRGEEETSKMEVWFCPQSLNRCSLWKVPASWRRLTQSLETFCIFQRLLHLQRSLTQVITMTMTHGSGTFGHCCLLYSPSVVWEVFFHRADPLVNKVCITDGITPSLRAFLNQPRKGVCIQPGLIAFMTHIWTKAKARVKNKYVSKWKKFQTEVLIAKKL